jgi:hypothetical protein
MFEEVKTAKKAAQSIRVDLKLTSSMDKHNKSQ